MDASVAFDVWDEAARPVWLKDSFSVDWALGGSEMMLQQVENALGSDILLRFLPQVSRSFRS